MTNKWTWVGLGILFLLVVTVGLGFAINYFLNLPERINAMETIVLGQSHYVPGSQAALRVVVRDISRSIAYPQFTGERLNATNRGRTRYPAIRRHHRCIRYGRCFIPDPR